MVANQSSEEQVQSADETLSPSMTLYCPRSLEGSMDDLHTEAPLIEGPTTAPASETSDSQTPPEREWTLIFGNYTPIPVFIVTWCLSAAVFVLCNVFLPADIYNDYFGVISGYIALATVYMSVYFSSGMPDLIKPYCPNPFWGAFRMAICCVAGLSYTFFLRALLRYVLGVEGPAIVRAQYAMMQPHFILAAADFDIFGGFLTKQLKIPRVVQPLTWMVAAFEVWVHVYHIVPGLGDTFQQRISYFQVIHIVYLLTAVLFPGYVATLLDTFTRPTSIVRRGLVLTGAILALSVVIRQLLFLVLLEVLPDDTPRETVAYILRCGVTSMFPAIMLFAIYLKTRSTTSLFTAVVGISVIGVAIFNLAVFFPTVNAVVRYFCGHTGPWYIADTISWNFLIGSLIFSWAMQFNFVGLARRIRLDIDV